MAASARSLAAAVSSGETRLREFADRAELSSADAEAIRRERADIAASMLELGETHARLLSAAAAHATVIAAQESRAAALQTEERVALTSAADATARHAVFAERWAAVKRATEAAVTLQERRDAEARVHELLAQCQLASAAPRVQGADTDALVAEGETVAGCTEGVPAASARPPGGAAVVEGEPAETGDDAPGSVPAAPSHGDGGEEEDGGPAALAEARDAMRAAVDAGDAAALRALLAEDRRAGFSVDSVVADAAGASLLQYAVAKGADGAVVDALLDAGASPLLFLDVAAVRHAAGGDTAARATAVIVKAQAGAVPGAPSAAAAPAATSSAAPSAAATAANAYERSPAPAAKPAAAAGAFLPPRPQEVIDREREWDADTAAIAALPPAINGGPHASSFEEAIANGGLIRVKQLVRMGWPVNSNACAEWEVMKSSGGQQPIPPAIYYSTNAGDLETTKYLISCGADAAAMRVRSAYRNHRPVFSLYSYAIAGAVDGFNNVNESTHGQVVAFSSRSKANNTDSAALTAKQARCIEVALWLVENFPAALPSQQAVDALMGVALQAGHAGLVRALLARGARLDTTNDKPKDPYSRTPVSDKAATSALHLFARAGDDAAVQWLLEHGAKVTSDACKGAAQAGSIPILERLALTGLTEAQVCGALEAAVEHRQQAVVRWFLAHGALATTVAFGSAARQGDVEMLELLQGKGVTAETMQAALMLALETPTAAAPTGVRWIVAHGADLTVAATQLLPNRFRSSTKGHAEELAALRALGAAV